MLPVEKLVKVSPKGQITLPRSLSERRDGVPRVPSPLAGFAPQSGLRLRRAGVGQGEGGERGARLPVPGQAQ
jgi:hypothetical protein